MQSVLSKILPQKCLTWNNDKLSEQSKWILRKPNKFSPEIYAHELIGAIYNWRCDYTVFIMQQCMEKRFILRGLYRLGRNFERAINYDP